MILIPSRVAPSGIHGNGLFAVEPVATGTSVWTHQPGFDQILDSESVERLPEPARRHVHWFAFRDSADGSWHLSGDHACFMNHAEAPNTGRPANQVGPVVTVALRDIQAGEELTCDYRAFDLAASEKLGSG